MIWLMIIGMAVVTFSVRYCFFSRLTPVEIHPSVQRLLNYSAPSVMTAMWVPIVFRPQESLFVSIANPYLMAALITIGLAMTKCHLFLVVVLSMASFWLLNTYVVGGL